MLQSLDESQIPLFLWNTNRVEFAYKVKLEDQFNIKANTWAVPLTGVPIERVVNIDEDCIVVRPLSSAAAASPEQVPSDVDIPNVSAASPAIISSSATSSLTSVDNQSDFEGNEEQVSPLRSGKEDCRSYRDTDVLIGENVRTLLKKHPGNVRFRHIVKHHKEELLQMKTSGAVALGRANFDKILNDACMSIIAEVKSDGARFMYQKGRGSWVVSSDQRVLKKIFDHLIKMFDDVKSSPSPSKAPLVATSRRVSPAKKVRNKVGITAKLVAAKKAANRKKSSTPKISPAPKVRRTTLGKYQRYTAVGKKFRIKCGKEKYHQGRVVAYNRSTGKHTVAYGPVGENWPERVLNLSSNTIIWD